MFIVLEGLSGCGKSSVANELVNRGWARLSPPPDAFVSARRYVDDRPSALEARHALFFSGVLALLDELERLVLQGSKVVADSWFQRTYVTHKTLGSRLELGEPAWTRSPDAIFFLDLDDRTRAARRASRGTKDPYWKAECELRSREIRSLYFQLYADIKVVDASRSLSDIVDFIEEVANGD